MEDLPPRRRLLNISESAEVTESMISDANNCTLEKSMNQLYRLEYRLLKI